MGNYFKHWKEKRWEDKVFSLEKEKILRRKANPKHEIGVSIESLKFYYPIEIYPISDEGFLRILRRLANDKDNLFENAFDSRRKQFIYIGNIEGDKK